MRIRNEVTAFFGGRFDPPHLGHREAVKGLLQSSFSHFQVKRVFILPSPSPAYKPCVIPLEHRIEMTQLNFSNSPLSFSSSPYLPYPSEDIEVHSVEINRSKRNPELPTYSYDTIQELLPQFPNLAFVIGADQLKDFHLWHRFKELISLCHWIVLERKPNGKENSRRTLKEWEKSGLIQPMQENERESLWKVPNKNKYFYCIPTDAPPLSSTWIREEIGKTGKIPSSSLLPEVEGYLKQFHLYGIKGKQ